MIPAREYDQRVTMLGLILRLNNPSNIVLTCSRISTRSRCCNAFVTTLMSLSEIHTNYATTRFALRIVTCFPCYLWPNTSKRFRDRQFTVVIRKTDVINILASVDSGGGRRYVRLMSGARHWGCARPPVPKRGVRGTPRCLAHPSVTRI